MITQSWRTLFLLFIFSVSFLALRAEKLYLGTYITSGCTQFETLAAYQVGSSILVTSLKYSSGICFAVVISDVRVAEIAFDGPALIASPQYTFMSYGSSVDAPPVVLSVQGQQLNRFDPELAGEYSRSPLLGYIDARQYPWVYSDYHGWLYVVPSDPVSAENYLTFIEELSADYGLRLEQLNVLNAYWFCNEDGEWLYGSLLSAPYLWNATTEEWVPSQFLVSVG